MTIKINLLNGKAIDNENEILSKFENLFSSTIPNKNIGDYFDVEKGSTITEKDAKEGDIPVVAGGKTAAYYHNTANRPANIITVSASGSSGFVNFWDKPIFASDCNTILSKDEKMIPTIYLYYYLKWKQDEVYKLKTGLQPSHVYAEDLKVFKFPIPNSSDLKQFLDFVKINKAKIKEIQEQLVKIASDKKIVVDKYFK